MSAFTLSNITAFGGRSNATYKNAGAGTIFLKSSAQSYGDLIIDNNNTATEGNSTTLPAVGRGFSTSLEPNKLTNTGVTFIEQALIGIKLNPKTDQDRVFTIVANDKTSLTTNENEDDMTLIASPGYGYIGEHHVFDVTVKGLARVFTLDRIKVFGNLVVEPGATLKADNLER